MVHGMFLVCAMVLGVGCDEGHASIWSPDTTSEQEGDSGSGRDTGGDDSGETVDSGHGDTGSSKDTGSGKDTATSKDTGSGDKDTATNKDTGTGKDTATSKDTGSGEEDTGEECVCPDMTNATKSCQMVRSCKTASDCCASISAPYTCNVDYPFLFECVSGKCRSVDCSTNSQCSHYYAETKKTLPDFVGLGCKVWTDPCTKASHRMCTIERKRPCSKATDCCSNVTDGFTCEKDYPYLADCVAGYCEARGCESDGECRTYFDEFLSSSDGATYDCKAGPKSCYGWPTSCEYKVPGAVCAKASDCCPSYIPDGFVCNEDSPYIYECKAGRCAPRGCENVGQCEAYYDLLSAGGMVGDGCR
jgi:hypothetical protein